MRYFLRLLGPSSYRLQVAPGRVLSIGRAPDSDLRIDDSKVSRRHCEVEVREDKLLLRDLGSRNGTALDGEKFKGEIVASPGSRLKIGSAFVLLEADEGLAGASASGDTQPAVPLAASDPDRRGERTERAVRSGRQRALPRIPGFEVLGEISQARTGRILRARPSGGGGEVAVKVVEPDPAARDRAIERFQREARALQRLNHPNIVRIQEANQSGDLCYYVMEYVPGETLAERLEGGPLGAREALAAAIQVSNALALAHREGVVHRDVCPSSIILTTSGIAKLFDFAFAKSDEGQGGSLTGIGEVIGDLQYCSPEQASDPRAVDHRTDLYALGATLFHAIAGRPPFVGKTQLEMVRLILASPAPKLREHAPDAPAAVEAIVAKLLAKAAADRYQSADEVHAALEAALVEACAPASQGGSAQVGAGTFEGAFSGMELIEIVQFLEFNKKDGVLAVLTAGGEGKVRFAGGSIVGARVGELEGEAAVLAMLEADVGTFRFRAAGAADKAAWGSLRLQPSVIAVEAMRRRDERRAP